MPPAPEGTQHVVFLLGRGEELFGKKNRHGLGSIFLIEIGRESENMAEFEYRTPVIPQLNFKIINSKRCQMLESGSLNYHNLNLQHMLIQEYKQVLSQADHGCGYPKDSDVLKSYLLFQNHQ
jgi:hypothetical protein